MTTTSPKGRSRLEQTNHMHSTEQDISAYAEGVIDALRKKLTSAGPARLSFALRQFPAPEAMAERIFASIPTADVWDERIGPFFDTAGLERWKGVSRQALHRQVRVRSIIGLKTSDQEMVYPSFQFDTNGSPLPNLREVLEALDPDNIDPWGNALWLNTTTDLFEGESPAAMLRVDRFDKVLPVARRAGAMWAS